MVWKLASVPRSVVTKFCQSTGFLTRLQEAPLIRHQNLIAASSYQLQRMISTSGTLNDGKDDTCSPASGGAGGAPYGKNKMPEVVATLQGPICTITINNQKKNNGINRDMFLNLAELYKEADADPAVKMLVITGAGKMFCGGNDLTTWDWGKPAAHGTANIRTMVDALIDLKKPLFALVNGPCFGIGTTMLAHCDAVYAAKSVYFWTPFTILGITAEACSTYLFPKMVGNARATELLMFNPKFGADEAAVMGLVTKVFPDASFAQDTAKIVGAYSRLPTSALMKSKELIRGPERAKLHKINHLEFDNVDELINGEECKKAVQAFMAAAAKGGGGKKGGGGGKKGGGGGGDKKGGGGGGDKKPKKPDHPDQP